MKGSSRECWNGEPGEACKHEESELLLAPTARGVGVISNRCESDD